jgi:hypothetical protein
MFEEVVLFRRFRRPQQLRDLLERRSGCQPPYIFAPIVKLPIVDQRNAGIQHRAAPAETPRDSLRRIAPIFLPFFQALYILASITALSNPPGCSLRLHIPSARVGIERRQRYA